MEIQINWKSIREIRRILMSYFWLVTLIVPSICLVSFIIGICIGNFLDFTLGGIICGFSFVGLFVFVFGWCLGFGKGFINANHYNTLQDIQTHLEQRIRDDKPEGLDTYKSELNKVNKKLEKQGKTMSYKDWDYYYKHFYFSIEEK